MRISVLLILPLGLLALSACSDAPEAGRSWDQVFADSMKSK